MILWPSQLLNIKPVEHKRDVLDQSVRNGSSCMCSVCCICLYSPTHKTSQNSTVQNNTTQKTKFRIINLSLLIAYKPEKCSISLRIPQASAVVLHMSYSLCPCSFWQRRFLSCSSTGVLTCT